MLKIIPNCEHCNKDLPNISNEAMICSFECTYCMDCALDIFKNVCPSCGGNFEKRPIRPSLMVENYGISQKRIYDPKDMRKAQKLIDKFSTILPEKR